MIDLTRRLTPKEREKIRRYNYLRPRCAGCGGELRKFNIESALITPAIISHPGYQYLVELEYMAGDLICFWCADMMLNPFGERHQWGHA